MGERFLFDALEWSVSREDALKRLRVSEDDLEDFDDIYARTVELIKPVYYAGSERVVANDGNELTLGKEKFSSRVVCVNLERSETVYPFVGTSGRAAYEYALSLDDELYRYWADQICELALRSAGRAFMRAMHEIIGSSSVSVLSPGSVIDWPISQQAPLFRLLGDVYGHTGILLEKSFLMRPVKSHSGIIYVSEKHFESCSLCPRLNCPNRRAPFEKDKYEMDYFSGNSCGGDS